MTTVAHLVQLGATRSRVQANLDARRWQRLGRAIVLHAGPLTRDQRWHAALINVGPRSLLTAFTCAELAGLKGWTREDIHIVAPYGAKSRQLDGLPITLHRSKNWPIARSGRARCEALAPALLRAASSLDVRPACGIFAAAGQQRLVVPSQLRQALEVQTNARHHAALLHAVHDIEGGAQALSEIDFVRLCRRAGLPAPEQQTVRRDSNGRNRYLDATWRRADGRLVIVEVDGALHLDAGRWWDDQLRQNDLALAGAIVLRFPSVVVREQPDVVMRQVRRALYD